MTETAGWQTQNSNPNWRGQSNAALGGHSGAIAFAEYNPFDTRPPPSVAENGVVHQDVLLDGDFYTQNVIQGLLGPSKVPLHLTGPRSEAAMGMHESRLGTNPYVLKLVMTGVEEVGVDFIQKCLPVRRSNEQIIEWDMFSLDKQLVGEVPAEGVSQIIRTSKAKGRAKVDRRGAALQFDRAFFQTPEGIQTYRAQFAALVKTIDATVVQAALAELVCSPCSIMQANRDRRLNLANKGLVPLERNFAEREEVARYACLLEGRPAFELIVNQATASMQRKGRGRPDILLVPPGCKFFLTFADGYTQAATVGPAAAGGITRDEVNGCTVLEAAYYQDGAGAHAQRLCSLVRNVSVGEAYPIMESSRNFLGTGRATPAGYVLGGAQNSLKIVTKRWLDDEDEVCLVVYDEERDCMRGISRRAAARQLQTMRADPTRKHWLHPCHETSIAPWATRHYAERQPTSNSLDAALCRQRPDTFVFRDYYRHFITMVLDPGHPVNSVVYSVVENELDIDVASVALDPEMYSPPLPGGPVNFDEELLRRSKVPPHIAAVLGRYTDVKQLVDGVLHGGFFATIDEKVAEWDADSTNEFAVVFGGEGQWHADRLKGALLQMRDLLRRDLADACTNVLMRGGKKRPATNDCRDGGVLDEIMQSGLTRIQLIAAKYSYTVFCTAGGCKYKTEKYESAACDRIFDGPDGLAFRTDLQRRHGDFDWMKPPPREVPVVGERADENLQQWRFMMQARIYMSDLGVYDSLCHASRVVTKENRAVSVAAQIGLLYGFLGSALDRQPDGLEFEQHYEKIYDKIKALYGTHLRAQNPEWSNLRNIKDIEVDIKSDTPRRIRLDWRNLCFSVICARPNITHAMGDAVVMAGGGKAGRTYVGNTDFTLQSDAGTDTVVGNFTMNHKTVIHDPDSVVRFDAAYSCGYITGNCSRPYRPKGDVFQGQFPSGSFVVAICADHQRSATEKLHLAAPSLSHGEDDAQP